MKFSEYLELNEATVIKAKWDNMYKAKDFSTGDIENIVDPEKDMKVDHGKDGWITISITVKDNSKVDAVKKLIKLDKGIII